MNQASVWRVVLCSAVFSVTACENGDVNIGDGSPSATLGASLEDYEGEWVGYTEAHEFSDGSDRLTITLGANGSGQLRVGDSPQASLPTDPEAPYPPGTEYLDLDLNPQFVYGVLDAAVSDRRIKFQISIFDPYKEYCASLEPIWSEINMAYLCGRNDATASTWRDSNCMGACDFCTAEACSAYDFPPSVTFDGALEAGGDELNGTLARSFERYNVRLFRE
jgi:hypothetical protein